MYLTSLSLRTICADKGMCWLAGMPLSIAGVVCFIAILSILVIAHVAVVVRACSSQAALERYPHWSVAFMEACAQRRQLILTFGAAAVLFRQLLRLSAAHTWPPRRRRRSWPPRRRRRSRPAAACMTCCAPQH